MLVSGQYGKENSPIRSVFGLLGRNEDALTAALGFAFENNRALLTAFLRKAGVLGQHSQLPRDSIKVALQELHRRDQGGRKDITIECGALRIVIEAKIDGSIPSIKQLTQYALTAGTDGLPDLPFITEQWGRFSSRHIVTLTRRKPPEHPYRALSNTIAETLTPTIHIHSMHWGEILEIIRSYGRNDWILDELHRFINEDFFMRYYEEEIICRHVVKDDRLDITLKEPLGYYFDGARQSFTYPEALFFCPVTGPSRNSRRRAQILREILSYEKLSVEEITNRQDSMTDAFFNTQLIHFPHDREAEFIHVFTLGKKIPIPERNQNFTGSALFYKNLVDLLCV